MIKAVSSNNFATEKYCSRNNISKPVLNFGQNNDEFVSGNKKEIQEKTFLEKHAVKIFLILGLIIGAIALKGKFSKAKVKDEIKPKINENTPKITSETKNQHINSDPPSTKNSELEVEIDPDLKNLENLTRKIKEEPTNLTHLNNRAKTYSKIGEYKEAI